MLDELLQAAANGPDGLAERERAAVDPFNNGPATVAVRGGRNVQAVAKRYGITNPEYVSNLEIVAVYTPGYEAIERGEINSAKDVRALARLLGISTAKIAFLTEKAIDFAVRGGGNVQTVAGRYDITDPKDIDKWERVAVSEPGTAAIERGDDPEDVADLLGIRNPKNVASLKMVAANLAVKKCKNVETVVKRLKITDPESIAEVESAALDWWGKWAFQSGDTHQEVADQLGIRNPENIARLKVLAAELAIERGENVRPPSI